MTFAEGHRGYATPGILAAVGSLILGISMIQLANGYVGTLVGIRLAIAQIEPIVAGVVTGAYFAGYAAGAVLCHRLIGRVGHIRASAAFAACRRRLLRSPPNFDPVLWAALRGLAGFGCAGLYVTTESWLNDKATVATRGKVFATHRRRRLLRLRPGQWRFLCADPAICPDERPVSPGDLLLHGPRHHPRAVAAGSHRLAVRQVRPASRGRLRGTRLRRPGAAHGPGQGHAVVPGRVAPARRLHGGDLSGLRRARQRPHAGRARGFRERPLDLDHRSGCSRSVRFSAAA
jgi:hypothetical protein